MAWPALARRVAGSGRRAAQESSVRRAASTCARHALVAAARPICAAAGPAAGVARPPRSRKRPYDAPVGPRAGRGGARERGAAARFAASTVARSHAPGAFHCLPSLRKRPRVRGHRSKTMSPNALARQVRRKLPLLLKVLPPAGDCIGSCCGALFPRRRGAIQSRGESDLLPVSFFECPSSSVHEQPVRVSFCMAPRTRRIAA